MILRRYLCILACLSAFLVLNVNAQERARIVGNVQNNKIENNPAQSQIPPQTSNQQPTTQTQRPTLTNKIVVAPKQQQQSLVKKTGSSQPLNAPANATTSKWIYAATINSRMQQSMNSKLGIRYVYNSMGPDTYDCSGLVWSVFQEAGFYFERSSAKSYWENFEPVEGDDRYKFGTLVFFNRLGHVGIVVDDKGFYHASSSKGVTYSPFEGYWEKRIVGFRRVPLNNLPLNLAQTTAK